MVKRKIRKYKGGGMDASKSDFGTTGTKGTTGGSGFDYEGDAYGTKSMNTYTGGDNTTGNATQSKNLNTGETTALNIIGKTAMNIPGLGFAIKGVAEVGKAIQKGVRQKKAKGETLFGNAKTGNAGMPITRDYYRTTGKPLDVMSPAGESYMKDAGLIKSPVTVPPGGGGKEMQSQLCPDGTNPPCKTPATQTSKKNPFLSGFQSYDEGGEIVISSNVDKSLL